MAFFQTKISVLHESGYCYCSIPEAIALDLEGKGVRRVHCTVEGKGDFHVTLKKLKTGVPCVYISRRLRKNMQLEIGDSIRLQVVEDTSPLQFAMPEALGEVLHTDPEAEKAFDKLTDGRKRSLMHWVSTVKSVDKQIERSLRIAERISMGLTDLKEITRK